MGMNPDSNENIDVVILWVDGNDPEWLKEKDKYAEHRDASKDSARYRDWGVLHYWFRGIEKFLPWVRKIHFVTWGHLPVWLNTDNPRLNIVKHTDFIPEQYLPTYNSPVIELNLHRIEGLAEHFIYFNDDMFVLRPMRKSDFFVNGIPCETGIMNVTSKVPGWENESFIQFNNAGIINKYFNKKIVLSKYRKKWFSIKYGRQLYRNLVLYSWPYFTGFYTNHLPTSMKKSTFVKVWKKEYAMLDTMCRHKFRSPGMVNQWLIAEWQMCEGCFIPRNPRIGRTFALSDNDVQNQEIFKEIQKQNYKMICINDYIYDNKLFGNLQKKLNESFERILSEKSCFEV